MKTKKDNEDTIELSKNPRMVKKKIITGKQVASILHSIHKHDLRGRKLYYEKDLLLVLKKLGLPKPEWSTLKIERL